MLAISPGHDPGDPGRPDVAAGPHSHLPLKRQYAVLHLSGAQTFVALAADIRRQFIRRPFAKDCFKMLKKG